ncbi:MAG: hypothetical protein K2X74_00605 [Acetobacteraceae bacterium]|nr:hypothetical protein [Acetobacteraceae bacterium]
MSETSSNPQPGDLIVNTARGDLPVFRFLTARDSAGVCKAARLGGKRASIVTIYPGSLPAHLRIIPAALSSAEG